MCGKKTGGLIGGELGAKGQEGAGGGGTFRKGSLGSGKMVSQMEEREQNEEEREKEEGGENKNGYRDWKDGWRR